MIPLFTPATARKDVNKTPGDGELAKLANLNRLVENVNTIVAEGLPASAPIFTYSITGGSTSYLRVEYVITSGELFNQVTGLNTVQTFYSPVVSMDAFIGSAITFFTEVLTRIYISHQYFPASTLEVINFPNLTQVVYSTLIDSGLYIAYVEQLTTINFPLLTKGNVDIENCDNLTTIDISSITNDCNFVITNCQSITLAGISFDSQFSNFSFSNCDALESTISLVATDIYTRISGCNSVTTVSFPNAVFYDEISCTDNVGLVNLSLGSIGTVKEMQTNLYFYTNALNSASITHILDVLISLDGTNGTTLWGPDRDLDISGGTNAVPSAGDLVKIATLEARGATVNYNT